MDIFSALFNDIYGFSHFSFPPIMIKDKPNLTFGHLQIIIAADGLFCQIERIRVRICFIQANYPINDPYNEHDFGSFDYKDEKIFWKIDYYDKNYQYLSEDPANPNLTNRVMTVMLASEY